MDKWLKFAMKQLILYLFMPLVLFSQDWSEWHTVYSLGTEYVQIRYQLGKCSGGTVNGWPRYEIKSNLHEFYQSGIFKITYTKYNCDQSNSSGTESISMSTLKTKGGILADKGMWHLAKSLGNFNGRFTSTPKRIESGGGGNTNQGGGGGNGWGQTGGGSSGNAYTPNQFNYGSGYKDDTKPQNDGTSNHHSGIQNSTYDFSVYDQLEKQNQQTQSMLQDYKNDMYKRADAAGEGNLSSTLYRNSADFMDISAKSTDPTLSTISGITAIGTQVWAQLQEDAEKRRAEEAEQERIWAAEQKQKELEAQQRREEEEAKRQIRATCWSNIRDGEMPQRGVVPPGTTACYFLANVRNEVMSLSNVFEIYAQSDGSWMYKSDFTRQLSGIFPSGETKVVGPFNSKEEAQRVADRIERFATNSLYRIEKANHVRLKHNPRPSGSGHSGNDEDDFWGNPKKEQPKDAASPVNQPTPQPQDSLGVDTVNTTLGQEGPKAVEPSTKDDFWGNGEKFKPDTKPTQPLSKPKEEDFWGTGKPKE